MSLEEARLCQYTSVLVSVLEVSCSKMLEFLLASTITVYEWKVYDEALGVTTEKSWHMYEWKNNMVIRYQYGWKSGELSEIFKRAWGL